MRIWLFNPRPPIVSTAAIVYAVAAVMGGIGAASGTMARAAVVAKSSPERVAAGPAVKPPAADKPAAFPKASVAPVPQSTPPAIEQRPPTILDDEPERFTPAKPRSEAEQEHIEALSLFSAARLRENRQDYAGALQLYERALRSDPQTTAIVRAIVPLAERLNRHAEAVRYALKLAEIEEPDPQLLTRLGIELAKGGQWSQAIAWFEKAAAARKTEKAGAPNVLLWMELGRLYFLTQQYAKAATSFARAMDAFDHPDRFGLNETTKKAILADPGPTYALIGECFLLAGEQQKAIVAFEKSHRLAPNEGLLAYHLAEVDLKTGKPDKALDRLQVCFDKKLAGEDTHPYKLLADALKALHRSKELLPRLEKLHAADPNNAALSHFFAGACFDAGEYDKAEKLYRSQTTPKAIAAGYLNLVEIYRKQKRYDDALNVLAEVVAKIGTLEPLEASPSKTDEAVWVRGVIEAARKRMAKDPKSLGYDARLATALLAIDGKQWDGAAEFFDLAIRERPSQASKLLLTWGLSLLLAEQPARAVKVFQRGIDDKALGTDDPTFSFYLAGALETNGQTSEALSAAKKAVAMAAKRAKFKPELPRYQSRVAWIFYHAKKYDEAVKAYRGLIDTYHNDYSSDEVRNVLRETRLILSNIAVLRGDNRGAEAPLEEVLDEFPDDASALNDLGYLWADQGKRLERAERMIRQAVAQEPGNAAYRDSLGWVLFRQGKIAEALVELEKAVAAEPDPTVLEHLGDAYQAAARADKSTAWWRKAAEAYRKSHDEDKAKRVEAKIKPAPKPKSPDDQHRPHP